MRTHRVITTIWTSCVAASWVWCMFCVQRFLSEPVRPGTVVSVLFLIVLFSANYWGMITSLAASITAALFFVTFFQPPLGRFAATPQGWVSTTSFVLASLLVSQLSPKARRSAAEAIRRCRESELIEQFGRGRPLIGRFIEWHCQKTCLYSTRQSRLPSRFEIRFQLHCTNDNITAVFRTSVN